MIGLSANRSLARQGGNRLSIGMSTALHSRSTYSMLNTITEKRLKAWKTGTVAGGEIVDRLGGEGDGVQEDQDDDEGVDQAARGMGVTADLEDVVDLAPPAPPGGLRRHRQARPARRFASASSGVALPGAAILAAIASIA